MRSSRFPERAPPRAAAFSLLELAIVLFIMALVLASLAAPIAAQVHLRRIEDTRRALEEAQETLLGFVAAHARLPCPASAASRGMESFAPGGDASNGRCSHFHDGFLPAAALGLPGLDGEGFARDAWGTEHNRLRYAVFGADGDINGVSHALTRTNGMQLATLPALGAASHYLFICTSGAAAGASGCGPATQQLTRRAALVLLSTGVNAGIPPGAGSDEARNLDGDAVFVAREPSAAAGHEFDDIVHWVAVHLVVNRLIVAGRLP
jgi:type II secretory pathway pseudopilin PulG